VASQAAITAQAAVQQDSTAAGGGLGGTVVTVGASDAIDGVITELEAALSTLRVSASTLGSNISLLKTRLDFTESFVDTLEAGASKFTLANLNEEGANLLALQTRQALGTQALSFARQSEQGILQLF
jgi:flagellin-like hook-associated protein FlgL